MGEPVPVRKTEAAAASTGAATPADPTEAEAAARFVADLVARGEAVEKGAGAAGRAERSASDPDEDAPLPPGVTHEIVRGEEDEPPTVRRRRYSAF